MTLPKDEAQADGGLKLIDRAVAKLKARDEPAARPEESGGQAKTSYSTNDRDAPAPSLSTQTEFSRCHLNSSALLQRGFIVPGQTRDRVLLEEYRHIKRAVLFKLDVDAADDSSTARSRAVMITSAIDGEGKTFVSINLAFSLCGEINRGVILIDGDVVRRGLSRELELIDRPGLTDLLDGRAGNLAEVLVDFDGLDGLCVMPAGSIDARADELLASPRMTELLDELAEQYPDRVVLIDAPPITMTNEALTLERLVGHVIVVVLADKTPQHLVDQALEEISPERFLGFVLNAASRNLIAEGYGYGYYASE